MQRPRSTVVPRTRARWYFDFTSYYSYLQLEKLTHLGVDDMVPVAVELGVIFAHWENRGPHAIRPKREFALRQARWIAGKLGVAFRMPPVHPFGTRNLSLLAIELGCTLPVVRTIFRTLYADGEDATDRALFRRLASDFDLEDASEVFSERNVRTIERNNAEAIGCGVFGTPAIVHDATLYWGLDATDMFLEAAGRLPERPPLELG